MGCRELFEREALTKLYAQHGDTLKSLNELENKLNARFFRMENAVHALILAALTGEALVMIGPPGTAKSRLIRSFCNLTGILGDSALQNTGNAGPGGVDAKEERYFEYLLTQFTEPSELFGFFDLGKLFAANAQDRAFERQTEGMMQKAEVVFLDEVFNASSAILNALLTFMNERKFHDRGKIVRTPLRLLVSATNHTPRDEGLGAVYDRFLLRARLTEVQVDDLETLMRMGWNETHATHGAVADATVMKDLLNHLHRYQTDVDAMTNAGELTLQDDKGLILHLKDFVATLRRAELSRMSNRRIVKFMGIFLAEALLRHARAGQAGPPEVERRDLQVLLDFGLDTYDDGIVSRLREHLIGR